MNKEFNKSVQKINKSIANEFNSQLNSKEEPKILDDKNYDLNLQMEGMNNFIDNKIDVTIHQSLQQGKVYENE